MQGRAWLQHVAWARELQMDGGGISAIALGGLRLAAGAALTSRLHVLPLKACYLARTQNTLTKQGALRVMPTMQFVTAAPRQRCMCLTHVSEPLAGAGSLDGRLQRCAAEGSVRRGRHAGTPARRHRGALLMLP